MMHAKPVFEQAIAALPHQSLTCPFISNRDGNPTSDDATIRKHLIEQLTHPVRWTTVLDTLANSGVRDIVLLGPGKVLGAQVRRALPEVRIHRTDRAVDLRNTATALGR